MALTNDDNALVGRAQSALPLAALDQLARLHDETSNASRLALFLRASVHAAALFMLMGGLVLLLGGGTTIGREFSWGVLVLVGVVALLHSYIRTNAAVFDRAPVTQAAQKLRFVLFYMGIAWGAGAFLALPADLPTLPALLFAVLPTLALALLLNDTVGLCAFLAPCSLVAIAAAMLRHWPHAGLDTGLILLVQWGLVSAILIRSRRRIPPAGLALR